MTVVVDLAIALPTYFGEYGFVSNPYERATYYNACIQSLLNVNWLGLDVVIVLRDDCSSKPPELPAIPNIKVDFKVQPTHLGMDGNCWDAVFTAQKLGHWVLWLDCDGIMSKNCIRRAFEMIHKEPKAYAYSLYNSPYKPTLEKKEGYVLKSDLPELGAMWRSTDLKITQPTRLAEALAGPYPTLHPSGVQHIGLLGMNNPVGNDFDPEFNVEL